MRVTAYAHGVVRDGDGPAAVGGLVMDEAGTVRAQVSERIGITSDEVAMLHAVRAVLEAARDAGATHLDVRVDSPFVVRALTGGGQSEVPGLTSLLDIVENGLRGFDVWTVEELPREENQAAVDLARAALEAPVETVPPEPLPPASPPEEHAP